MVLQFRPPDLYIRKIAHSHSTQMQQNLALTLWKGWVKPKGGGGGDVYGMPWCACKLVYLRLSSIPNILSVASPSGKQDELVESLRATGLPERTAQQNRQMSQAMTALLRIMLTCCSFDISVQQQGC